MGQLSYNKQNQKFFFTVDDVNGVSLAKKAGFTRDPHTLQWASRSITKACALRAFSDESAERKFKYHFITHFVDRPECISYPDHLLPRVFQIESAWHCVTRSPAYCADEAGLGKTIVSVLCMNSVPGRVLVICPPYLKYNWEKEIKLWSTTKRTIGVIEGIRDATKKFNSDIVICPDSIINSPVTRAKIEYSGAFEWCFIDEAHRFKDENAQRTQALIPINKQDAIVVLDSCKRVVFLSGTPMPSRPIELWSILGNVAPESIKWRSYKEYTKTFCDLKMVPVNQGHHRPTRFVPDAKGASNMRQLAQELKKDFMIRHVKSDVLAGELPPKQRRFIYLDQPKKLLKLEHKLLKHRTLEEIMQLVEDEDPVTLGDLSTFRMESAKATIPDAITYIRDQLEAYPKEKFIVFAHHINVVDELYAAFKKDNALKIRGGMSASMKHAVVHEFQNNKKAKLLIGNIDSMGVGLTLTAAKKVVFVEYSWVPGVNEQAEDRAHRITQTDTVDVTYLVLRDGLNERMLRTVLSKEKIVKAALG